MSVLMSTNQFPTRILLQFIELREGQVAITLYGALAHLLYSLSSIFIQLVHLAIAHSKRDTLSLQQTRLPTYSKHHGLRTWTLQKRTPRFDVSSCRLARQPTLTRSTTPSGSEMGEVPPTFLMPPPATCGTFERHEKRTRFRSGSVFLAAWPWPEKSHLLTCNPRPS